MWRRYYANSDADLSFTCTIEFLFSLCLVAVFADVEDCDAARADMSAGDEVVGIDFDVGNACCVKLFLKSEGFFLGDAVSDVDGLVFRIFDLGLKGFG